MCGTRARAEPSGPGGCECNLVTEATVTICLKPNAAENMLGAALAMLLPALLPDAALIGGRPAGTAASLRPSAAASVAACRTAVIHNSAVRLGGGGDDGAADAAVTDGVPQAAQQVGWLKHVKSVGVTLATAAFLAVPRGPARASELPPPTTLSLQAKGSTPNSRPTLAFLGFRKKRKHTLVPPQVRGPPRADEIDMDALVSKKAAKRYTERSYIFSDAITSKSDLVDELEQLDEDANDRRVQKSASTLVMWGGAGGMVYLAVQGLQGIERYMKRQEEEDIEAERELTGQYVSVDAGDVESVIDPKTGKNITIAKRDPPKKKDANATDVDSAPKQTPWLLRKLGLDGVASSDDDDFWVAADAAQPSVGPSGGGGSASGASGATTDGSTGEGGDGGGDDGADGLDDDSSDIDDLDDLLG